MSVAFGSTVCRGSAGGLAPFAPQPAGVNVEYRSQTLPGGGGSGGMHRPEIFIIELSKMQFHAFSGSESVDRQGILRHY